MCVAQGPQGSDAGEALNRQPLCLESSTTTGQHLVYKG